MLIVHHLNNSRSQRVLWLLEELGLKYDIKFYQRDPKTLLAPAELTAVHPLGKSPVLEDGAVKVAESGAILEYLAQHHGGEALRPPPGSPDWLQSTYWLHYAEGSAMPLLLLKLIFDRLRSAPAPFFVKPIVRGVSQRLTNLLVTDNLRKHLQFQESTLAQTLWFSGQNFGIADIQMSFPVEAAEKRAPIDGRFPHLQKFLQRIRARPAYQRAMERGGPYDTF